MILSVSFLEYVFKDVNGHFLDLMRDIVPVKNYFNVKKITESNF